MVDYVFGLTWMTPLVFTVLVSLLTSTISQLAFAFFTDKDFISNGRIKMRELQKKLFSMKPEDKEYMALQNELLDLNMNMMTHSLKPTLFTMIPFLLIFNYARSVIPFDQPLINLPFSLPLIGNSFEFFGVYLIISLLMSTIIRRLLGR